MAHGSFVEKSSTVPITVYSNRPFNSILSFARANRDRSIRSFLYYSKYLRYQIYHGNRRPSNTNDS